MDLPEELAGHVLGLFRGVVVIPTDVPGAPPSTCDLLVATADTTTWAVEVTRAMDPVAAASWGAAAKRNWDLPGLGRCWVLVLEHGFHSKRVRDAAAAMLPRLESLGVFDVPQRWQEFDESLAEPVEVLWQAGVAHGGSCEAPSGRIPWVEIGTPGLGLAMSSDLASSLQAEIDKTDNRRKLQESGADERHLFIWIENDSSYPTMHDTDTEGVSITLPAEIDVVWAGRTLQGDWPITHLWRFDRDNGWEVLYRYGTPFASDLSCNRAP